MLRYDVRKRISAEEALNNKWINKNTSTALISSNAIKQLISFHVRFKKKSKKLKRFCLIFDFYTIFMIKYI